MILFASFTELVSKVCSYIKAKEHKNYEFCSKVSVTRNSGVIIWVLNIQGNNYDGHTLKAAKIGHLKADHRLSRNFYKGIKWDTPAYAWLAAAAMNFKRMMKIWKKQFWQLFYTIIFTINFLTKSHSAIVKLAK